MPRNRLLNNTEPEVHGASDTLVVLLHGIKRKLEDWCEALREFLPNADLLAPIYEAGVLSNADPTRIADQLAQYIHEADTKRSMRSDGGYKRIILIGYSGGSLLIRKSYLMAMGFSDDEVIQNSKAFPWTAKVERIILMAGINRGIPTHSPKNLSHFNHMVRVVGFAVAPVLGVGKFVCQLRRGTIRLR